MREKGPAGGGGAIAGMTEAGDLMCWSDEADGPGCSIFVGGTELGRVPGAEEVSPVVSACIWPLTEVNLLVNDDIAHPVHEEPSGCGVPVREILSDALMLGACGSRVSGRLCAYLRTR
jgi:hypothetical protein